MKIKTCLLQITFFETLAIRKIMCKYTLEPDRLQAAMWHGTWNLHAGWLRLQTHTQNMYYLWLLLRN